MSDSIDRKVIEQQLDAVRVEKQSLANAFQNCCGAEIILLKLLSDNSAEPAEPAPEAAS